MLSFHEICCEVVHTLYHIVDSLSTPYNMLTNNHPCGIINSTKTHCKTAAPDKIFKKYKDAGINILHFEVEFIKSKGQVNA